MLRGESALRSGDLLGGISQVIDHEPAPNFAHLVTEHLRELVDCLEDTTIRNVAILKLGNCINLEIAGRLGISLRSVQRKLNLVRQFWKDSEP